MIILDASSATFALQHRVAAGLTVNRAANCVVAAYVVPEPSCPGDVPRPLRAEGIRGLHSVRFAPICGVLKTMMFPIPRERRIPLARSRHRDLSIA